MSAHSAGRRRRPATGLGAVDAAHVPVGRLAVAHFGVDLLFGATVTLLPASNAADDFGASTIPVLLALEVAATSLPQPILGRLADRIGPRRMVVAGMGIGSAAVTGVVLAPTVAMVAALVVIAGLASAAFHPAAIGELSGDPAAGGRGTGLFTALGTLGFAVGPVCAALLIDRFGPGALALLLVPVTVAVSALVAAGPARRDVRCTVPLPQVGASLARLTAAAVSIGLAIVAVGAAMPMWLEQRHGLAIGSGATAVFVGVFTAATALGHYLGGAIAMRHTPGRVLVVTLPTSVVALQLLLQLEPDSAGFLAATVVAGLGLGAALQTLVISSLAIDRSGARAAGLVGGLAMGVASLGLLLAGVIADTTSTMFLAAIFALVPVGGIIARVPRLPVHVDAGIVTSAPRAC